MSTRSSRARRQGFSLVELLVVVVAILVIVAIGLTVANKVLIASGAASCKNRLKDIGLAVKEVETQSGFLPFNDGKQSIFTKILAGLDRSDLIEADVPVTERIPSFNCPMDNSQPGSVPPKHALGSYVLNAAVFRGSKDDPLTSDQAMDVAANTIMGGERLAACGTNPVYTAWSTTGEVTQAAPDAKLLNVAASPPNDLFGVNGIQQDGGTPDVAPVGMGVKAAVTQATCPAVPANEWAAAAGSYYFQSAHPGGGNFLKGDAGTVTLPGEYDPLLLNYFCAGNRSTWSGPAGWVTAIYGSPGPQR